MNSTTSFNLRELVEEELYSKHNIFALKDKDWNSFISINKIEAYIKDMPSNTQKRKEFISFLANTYIGIHIHQEHLKQSKKPREKYIKPSAQLIRKKVFYHVQKMRAGLSDVEIASRKLHARKVMYTEVDSSGDKWLTTAYFSWDMITKAWNENNPDHQMNKMQLQDEYKNAKKDYQEEYLDENIRTIAFSAMRRLRNNFEDDSVI